jgi:hypothetical protein
MKQIATILLLTAAIVALAACRQQAPQPKVDMVKLRQSVQEQTEKLYLIHLKLDSAMKEITEAEQRARGADCASAEYVAAEAYRYLAQADDDLIQLGQDLQALFGLDAAKANRQ